MKALVTGASSGIGKDISIYLGKLGYEVILVSRNKNDLEEVAKLIDTKSEIVSMDLCNRENVLKLYDTYKDDEIEFLVNCAGFGLFGNTWETDLEKELRMIDLNITCLHILTKLFLKDMVKRDKGYILNVGSSAGFLAGPVLNTYYASKNYVNKWTMAISEELRKTKSNVVVSCLCPGPVDTNFNNVAGGSFNMKALSSEYVAKYGVDKCLNKKTIIVPGFMVRMGIFFNKFLPYKLSLRIVYYIQNKKSKGR
ncbi:MAG: SDR family oxidoreductase [Bacilli bacterium]|nr:SDR family oxidoreductase [Bacilli bacterium]